MRRPWIKERLHSVKKTQKGLAAAVGVAPARINEMIDGRRRIYSTEVPLMAEYLEMDQDDLLSLERGIMNDPVDIHNATLQEAPNEVESAAAAEDDPIFIHCILRARDIVDYADDVSGDKRERTIQSVANVLFERVKGLVGNSSLGSIVSKIDDLSDEFKGTPSRRRS